MDLAPPFTIDFDQANRRPLIRSLRSSELVATLAHDGDVGMRLARLFAAAPDLQFAVKVILSTYDDGGMALNEAFNTARAALAKAQG